MQYFYGLGWLEGLSYDVSLCTFNGVDVTRCVYSPEIERWKLYGRMIVATFMASGLTIGWFHLTIIHLFLCESLYNLLLNIAVNFLL